MPGAGLERTADRVLRAMSSPAVACGEGRPVGQLQAAASRGEEIRALLETALKRLGEQP
jgi:hypothetical protein